MEPNQKTAAALAGCPPDKAAKAGRREGQGGISMKLIENQTMDQERALYGSEDILVRNCSFDGPADGESALKECRDVQMENCFCNLRYPFCMIMDW